MVLSILKITGTGTSLRSNLRSLNSYRRSRMVSTVTRPIHARMARIRYRSQVSSFFNSDVSRFSYSSPWLMLSPSSNNTSYDLYSFSKNRVLTIPKSEKIGYATKIVGSSHGWLACFNHRRGELFLSHPLSGLRVNLPPIHKSIPEPNLSSGIGIKKIIISCFDPESEECRAMMLFDIANRFAYCCPGRCTEWTIIESLQGASYQDFVYCGTHELLFSITNSIDFDLELEAWDLQNPQSPSLVWSYGVHKPEVDNDSIKQSNPAQSCSDRQNYLVVSHQGELFLVDRYINRYMLPDGSCAPMEDLLKFRYPPKTVNYEVYKIVREGDEGKKVYMDGHLNDVVMFIGWLNNGMAIPAADGDGFQPNTICFTDGAFTLSKSALGTDNGIFDYKNKTLHPCYYPCDYQSLKKKDHASAAVVNSLLS